ncbi:MAG: DUF3221 domain-containing protein [Christensenellales bacterium]|jgi:ABC-type uncharacterized transport system auxiliary subunit
MKKRFFCLLMICILLAGCTKTRTMNDILDEPNFAGTVIEVHTQSILIRVHEGEDALHSSDLMSVSLDVELKDSMQHFNIGDEVRVYYDGRIAESYPAQIHTVYAIVLINPSAE